MRAPHLVCLLLAACLLPSYQQPPPVIADILDASYPPAVRLSPDGKWFVELERPSLRTLDELAAPVVKVAGIKLDPRTRGPSRPYLYRKLTLHEVGKRGPGRVIELDGDVRVSHVEWHPDSDKFRFLWTHDSGITAWIVDAETATPKAMTGPELVATYGDPCAWLPGDEGLVCKAVPRDLGPPPAEPAVPEGPRIEQNLGRVTPARTYTNLLQSPHDEALFRHYLTSEVVHFPITYHPNRKVLHEAALILDARPSPDGRWVLVEYVHEPFSYQVPVRRFPRITNVVSLVDPTRSVGIEALNLADDVPVPFGSVRTGKRIIGWRTDLPNVLYLVEALDGGDAGAPAEKRDRLSTLAAPFDGNPKPLWESELRFSSVRWGDEQTALAWEWWYDTRQLRTWRLDPSDRDVAPALLWDRSYQDRYADPGTPLTTPGPWGARVLKRTSKGALLLSGPGASPDGVHPFLDAYDLETGATKRLWQSKDPYYETLVHVLDDDGKRRVTRRESKSEPPNYYAGRKALTTFADWAPQFEDVTKQQLEYERADGLPLNATLYLPPGYDPKRDGPLPTVFWAYPSEFKSKKDAGQKTRSENTFTRPYGSSVLMMLLAGYAVVDNPTIPIVGEGDVEPNDDYVAQLVAGAQAAVDTVVGMGVADPDRLLIGGHSYGAFTAANLLAHTDLFRAGIARSGAYNRSLTPFGFQSEQRTYWEATDVYVTMSPFTHAPKIDEPLLLLHGAEDPNAGTYPVQSKRMYAAMKGHGGTVRWVELPLEEHGYRARESIGHALWEMIRWADTYVKDAGPR